MPSNTAALAACLMRHPSMLRARPAASLALAGYMGKFRARKVGGWTFLHSHLPPLDHPAYGRFVRRHLLGRSPGPSHAQIAITDACPQRCAYCYNKGRAGVRMDTPTILRVVRELKALDAFWLGLTGGEPLLNPDIAAITAAAAPDCAVKLFTSGVGLTPGLAEDLKRAGLVSVSVSLDHWTEEVHDAGRGYPGAFKAALRAVGIFKEAGLHTGVSAVLSAEMVRRGEVDAYLEFLQGLGLDEAWLSETKPSLAAGGSAFGLLTEDERTDLRRRQDRWNKSGRMTVNDLGHFEGPDHFGCNAGTKMVYIDAFGEVGPCVFVPMSFGNVREAPTADVWGEMSRLFAPGDRCFMVGHHDRLRTESAGRVPIPPEASRRLMEKASFGPPGRFVRLMQGTTRRTT